MARGTGSGIDQRTQFLAKFLQDTFYRTLGSLGRLADVVRSVTLDPEFDDLPMSFGQVSYEIINDQLQQPVSCLVPAIGLAAFSLVVPITVAMLVVLGFLILSYRETIKEYPTAGGA